MRVTLNGEVAADEDLWIYEWFGIPAFGPGAVRQAIRDNPEGEDLTLEINSAGGSVMAGFEIYSVLRSAPCPTVAEVQSLAASAASTIMIGCQRTLLSPVAQVMIHNPSAVTRGNQEAHRETIGILDSITESILNGYELKCHGLATRDRLRQLMEEETWLPAQEAVDLGLADGILYQEGETPILPQDVVNAVGSGIRALAGGGSLPRTPEALRARYEDAVRAGAKPAEGHPVEGAPAITPEAPAPEDSIDEWRDKARLELEKTREIWR